MSCKSKHVEYEPITDPWDNNNEWKCPKCGIDNDEGNFYVLESYGDEECDLLHEDDIIFCQECEFKTTGKEFVEDLLKIKNMKYDKYIICPKCGEQIGVMSNES